MRVVLPGMKVKWRDPAIMDYSPADRNKELNRVRKVHSVGYSTYDCSATIDNGNTYVFWDELHAADQTAKDLERFFISVALEMCNISNSISMEYAIMAVCNNRTMVKRLRTRGKKPTDIAYAVFAKVPESRL